MSPTARLAPRYLTSLPLSSSEMSFFTTETLSDTPFTATTCQHVSILISTHGFARHSPRRDWWLSAHLRMRWSHIPLLRIVSFGLNV